MATRARPPRPADHLRAGSRTPTRTEHDGTVTVLASSFEGTRLTGPNDVIVKSDGSDLVQRQRRGHPVATISATRRRKRWRTASIVSTRRPANAPLPSATWSGRTASASRPTRSKLYVVDTPDGTADHAVYDMVDGKPVNGRLFSTRRRVSPTASAATPKAMCGAASAAPEQDGVAVFAPGRHALIGRILLPERCANLCFGGRKRNRLFMATASQSVYALYVEAQACPAGEAISRELRTVRRGSARSGHGFWRGRPLSGRRPCCPLAIVTSPSAVHSQVERERSLVAVHHERASVASPAGVIVIY